MGQGRGAKPHPVFFGSWGRAKILVVQPGAVLELKTTKTKTGNPRLKRGSENLRLSRAATARAWPTPQKKTIIPSVIDDAGGSSGAPDGMRRIGRHHCNDVGEARRAAGSGSVRCGPNREIEAGSLGKRPEIPVSRKQRNPAIDTALGDRKSTRLNSSHLGISYAV